MFSTVHAARTLLASGLIAATLVLLTVTGTFGFTLVPSQQPQQQVSVSGGADSTSTGSIDGAGAKEGIDVSHWQGAINWPKVKAAGIDFVFAKATDGNKLVDWWYRRNAIGAVQQGIHFTAYHYARPIHWWGSAIRQAKFFVAHANLQVGMLRPALDIELTGNLHPHRLIQWTLAWLKTVQRLTGVTPILYTSPGFWYDAMDDTTAIVDAGYTVLWIAHWGVATPVAPADQWGSNGWTFWQWTACGHVSGVAGCVDRDALVGAKLKALTITSLLDPTP